jgi:hypothetical protein
VEMLTLIGGLCCVGFINFIGVVAGVYNPMPGGITGLLCSWDK